MGVNKDGEVGLVLYEMGGATLPAITLAIVPDERNWSGNLGFASTGTRPRCLHQRVGDYAKVFPYDNCDKTFAPEPG